MPFTDKISQAIGLCILRRVPFVVYQYPEQDRVEFYSSPSLSSGGCNSVRTGDNMFFINFFGEKSDKNIFINLEYDAESTIAEIGKFPVNSHEDIEPWLLSTDKARYLSDLAALIPRLRKRNGKTVISKVIAGQGLHIDWTKVAERYFDRFPDVFRYLYYTPFTGCWLGATPELILKVDFTTGGLSTMALAGTRSLSASPWDDKNIKEHEWVVRYISDSLVANGIHPVISRTETISYGKIEHLCTPINGDICDADPFLLLDSLSPTPALGGFPLKDAVDDISEIEVHPRRCYGGYIGIIGQEMFMAYVNIRCVNFIGDKWCVYSGGGITPDSDPECEWIETEEKARVIKSLIFQYQSDGQE